MKIIPLYSDDTPLIKKAISANERAQRKLYEKYAPKMLALCKRYVQDVQYAEDVMIQGFFKVFIRLGTFKYEGSFEGWVRRIMVNESLNFIRKKKPSAVRENIAGHLTAYHQPAIALEADAEYLLILIADLSESYRLVFMLHAIEGFKHKEIAEVMRITESTSKSKLAKARKILRKKLEAQRKHHEAL